MLDWITIAPQFLLLLAVLIVPGFPWVRAFVRSSVVAAAAAPAVGLFFIVALAMAYRALGIPWGLPRAAPALALIGLLGLLLWRRVSARHPHVRVEIADSTQARPPLVGASPATRAYHQLTPTARIAAAVCLVIGWLIAALPLLIAAKPGDPMQQWDSTFHMNGVWWMIQEGNGSLIGGLSHLYGGDETVFYPNAWHAWTALGSTMTTVVQAANASTLVLMAVWVAGAAGLTAVLTNSRVAVLAAPIIAGVLPNMPADALTMYNQWPHATATAVLPGTMAIAVILGRRFWRATQRGLRPTLARLPFALVVAAAVCGGVAAHPTTAFGLLYLLLPPILATLVGGLRRALRIADPAGAVVMIAGLAVVVAAPLAVLASPQLQSMGDYPRSGYGWLFALQRTFTPYPPFAAKPGMFLTITIVALLALAGAVASFSMAAVWRRHASVAARDWFGAGRFPSPDDRALPLLERRRTWRRVRRALTESLGAKPLVWPVASFLVFCGLTLLAYGPDSAVRTFFTSPWYMDARRIMAYQDVPLVPLAALGFERAVVWLRGKRVRAADEHAAQSSMWRVGVILGAWLLAASLVGGLDARLWAVRYVADPDDLGKPGMATSGELAMIRRMPQTLPADAVVVGDPIAGEAYSEVIGQRASVYSQLTIDGRQGEDAVYLSKHFKDIHTDPEVCRIVRDLGVTHFYQDADGTYYNFERSSRNPGLYNVDTSRGFEHVDTGDSASLWRITACD